MKIVMNNSVNTPESLLTIEKGETARVEAINFASLSTVRSAITRLNQAAGFIEFEASTPDNGVTICIKRNEQ